MSYSIFARLVGLVSLYFMAAISAAYAQDADPGYPTATPAVIDVAPAILAQATLPAATPKVAPKRSAHDPLSPPVFQAGDKCTHVKSEWGRDNPPITQEIGSVSSRGVTALATWRTNDGRSWRNYRQYTPEGNLVSFFDGPTVLTYSQPKMYFHYPLVQGKTWDVSVDVPYFETARGAEGAVLRVQIGTIHERLTANFVGVETIKTPAGAFRTVHVRLVGTANVTIDKGELLSKPNGFDRFSLEEHVWYSTDLGCLVRRTWVKRHDLLGLSHKGARNDEWTLVGFQRIPRSDD